MIQFAVLHRERSTVFDAAARAGGVVDSDLSTACLYARRTLELAVCWAYTLGSALKLPYLIRHRYRWILNCNTLY